jgi:hypothetical protein
LPISAVDTINLAFQHTRRQLLQPFRFWQWTRLAIVGLLAGEAGSGSFNVPTNWNPPAQGGSSPSGFPHIDPALLTALIAVIVIAALVFMIVMTYISSVMRFILFDSVLTRDCHIRANWSRRTGPGFRFFLWQLAVAAITLTGFVILLGIPAAFAYGMGWFRSPRQHILGWVLGGIVVFCLFGAFLVCIAVVHVMTKDFVVPQMALEGVGALEGWRRLWPMVQAEKGGYAVYLGMKIVLAIGASIVIGIASVIIGLIIAIPAIGLGIVAVITGKSAGLEWNAFTITAAIIVGCTLFAIVMYIMALIAVPAMVFFPAYSIYFFAPRYRPLSVALYPPPPAPAISPPPPDIPPIPQPAT